MRFSTLFKTLVCLLLWVFSSGAVFAIESPRQYFDYNPYAQPQVLGEYDFKEFGGYFLAFTRDLTPTSPLYFLKPLQEQVALVFTTGNSVKRAETLLALGGERTSEIDQLAGEGKTGAIGSLVASYNRTMDDQANTLESLKGKPEAIPLMLETDKEVSKHMLTLEEVSLKVPEAAVAHINAAITKSEEVVDQVADASGRPAVPQEMIARLQSYKAQGLLSEEEIAKIVSAISRREARSEFRKLADSRVVPLADVKKFDEAAAAYYPEGYAKAVEGRKFRELTSLEKDRPSEAVVQAVQDFAKSYKPGDVVPPGIRSWWGPLVRQEELQATFRPDLLDAAAYFKYRPEEQQKFAELVERMKPTERDMQYVRGLVASNPTAANDPAYSRILTLGDRFGTADQIVPSSPVAASCSRESHWVNVPFMPGGGYCVPDLVYQSLSQGSAGTETACPPNYRRLATGGACYPDNPSGPGITQYLPAAGSCPSGYRWQTDSAGRRGGYCSPDYVTGSGGFPSPVSPPSYCPQGKMFREGKCEDYTAPPTEGCGQNSWWNGQKCIEQKNCGEGKYQDSNGECKSSADEYKKYQGGGGGGGGTSTESMKAACERGGCRWTGVGNACECPSGGSGGGGTPSSESQEATCRAGGGRCVSWVNGACGCERGTSTGGYSGSGYTPPPSSYNPEEMCRRTPNCSWANGACGCSSSGGTSGGPPAGGSGGGYSVGGSVPPSCGSGYYWNGSSCTANQSQPQPQPQPTSAPQPPPSEPQPSSPPPSSPPPVENPPPVPPPAESTPPPSP